MQNKQTFTYKGSVYIHQVKMIMTSSVNEFNQTKHNKVQIHSESSDIYLNKFSVVTFLLRTVRLMEYQIFNWSSFEKFIQ